MFWNNLTSTLSNEFNFSATVFVPGRSNRRSPFLSVTCRPGRVRSIGVQLVIEDEIESHSRFGRNLHLRDDLR